MDYTTGTDPVGEADPTGRSQEPVVRPRRPEVLGAAADRTAAIGGPALNEWTEIVEDLQRDVVEVPEPAPIGETVPDDDGVEVPVLHRSARSVGSDPMPEPDQGSANREVAKAVQPDVEQSAFSSALLTISLGPKFPGNVHVYAITIDARDGTFTGVADASSKIAAETISGALSPGYTDIEFRGVYSVEMYGNYLWFGSGALGSGALAGFRGGDTFGNLFDALSATVTMLAEVNGNSHDSAVWEDLPNDGLWIPVDEVPVEEPVVAAPRNVADDVPVSEPPTPVALVDDAARPDVFAGAVNESQVVADETPNNVTTEPEMTAGRSTEGAQAVADPADESPPEPDRLHGPLAGIGFYFSTTEQVPEDATPPEPPVTKPADENDRTAHHSHSRGKRRSLSSRERR